jgi:hypothetical protein
MASTVNKTPPTGWTVDRTITIAIYKPPAGTVKAPQYLLTDGTYGCLHASADNVRQDVLQRLSPRVKYA